LSLFCQKIRKSTPLSLSLKEGYFKKKELWLTPGDGFVILSVSGPPQKKKIKQKSPRARILARFLAPPLESGLEGKKSREGHGEKMDERHVFCPSRHFTVEELFFDENRGGKPRKNRKNEKKGGYFYSFITCFRLVNLVFSD
jgi:hypothetical protein